MSLAEISNVGGEGEPTGIPESGGVTVMMTSGPPGLYLEKEAPFLLAMASCLVDPRGIL